MWRTQYSSARNLSMVAHALTCLPNVGAKALQGVTFTLRDHTNTNLTKWSVFTGGYGAEISGSHQNQIFTEWAFFQPRRQQPSLKQTNRKYGLAKSGKRRGRDIETFCCTISKSWASILPCPEINYPLAPWPPSPQHLRPSHSFILIF